MRIGELARRSGLATSAIRYYEERGLLPKSARESGSRIFAEETLDRLLVIAFAKQAGFTLGEILTLFNGFASTTRAGMRWRKLAVSKLAEVEEQSRRLHVVKEMLAVALRCGCVDLDACGKLLRKHLPAGEAQRSRLVSSS